MQLPSSLYQMMKDYVEAQCKTFNYPKEAFIPVIRPINFFYPTEGLFDLQTRYEIVQAEQGNIVGLYGAYILRVHQPEYYLMLQSFTANCQCDNFQALRMIPLTMILKHNFKNLRESPYKTPSCRECKFHFTELKTKRIYAPCQKLEIFYSSKGHSAKGTRSWSSLSSRQTKVLTLWLENEYTERFRAGQYIDIIGYHDIALEEYLENGRKFARMNDFIIGISVKRVAEHFQIEYMENLFQSLVLESSMLRLPPYCKNDIYDLAHIDANWTILVKLIQNFSLKNKSFPGIFFGLKLSLLLSIVLISHKNIKMMRELESLKKGNLAPEAFASPNDITDTRVNICVVCDHVEPIECMILQGFSRIGKIVQFPSQYDPETLLQTLMLAEGGVLLVNNLKKLKKPELSILVKILKGQEIILSGGAFKIKVNCAVWILIEDSLNESSKRTSAQIGYARLSEYIFPEFTEVFDIVLNLREKDNIETGVVFDLVESYAEMLLASFTAPKLIKEIAKPSVAKVSRSFQDEDDESYSTEMFAQDREETRSDNHLTAISLLKQFYLSSRGLKTTRLSIMSSLRKIANGCALLRGIACSDVRVNVLDPDGEIKLELFDAFIAVLINEATGMFMYGSQSVMVGNAAASVLNDPCQREGPEFESVHSLKLNRTRPWKATSIYHQIVKTSLKFQNNSYEH